MRGSRVQFLVAAPSASTKVSDAVVSACIYRDISPCVVDTSLARGQNRASLLGGVPERSKGSDCKSDGLAFVGSNPTPSTMQSEDRLDCRYGFDALRRGRSPCVPLKSGELKRGYGSMVEPQPSKLKVRVRFPLPAPSSDGYPRRGRRTDGDPSRMLYCSHSSVGRALPW
jgi:hypothetical protein